jgi:protein-histidine N-methyltransferase
VISYTPLVIRPSDSSSTDLDKSTPAIIIPRRDLYDARFQIISEEGLSDDDTEEDESDDEDTGSDTSVEFSTTHPLRLRPRIPVSILEEEFPPLPPSPTLDDLIEEQESDSEKSDSAPDSPIIPVPRVKSTSKRPPQVSRSDRISRIKDLEYINAPSDVIPNVYEGGLKTWECSLDLVEYLSSARWQRPLLPDANTSSYIQKRENASVASFQGKKILEVGCGTATPTSFILQSLFNEPLKDSSNEDHPEDRKETVIHLQDYNRSVLELVTIPNLLLAWCTSLIIYIISLDIDKHLNLSVDSSNASQKYKSLLGTSPPDPASPSELSIDKLFLDHFLKSLEEYHIRLKLWAGSWSTFNPRRSSPSTGSASDLSAEQGQSPSAPPFDLVLTSETIYQPTNVPSLLRVLRSTCAHPVSIAPGASKPLASVFSLFGQFTGLNDSSPVHVPIILVAAKVLYFGVGGSVDDFERRARNMGAGVNVVMEKNIGVGRRILQLAFR